MQKCQSFWVYFNKMTFISHIHCIEEIFPLSKYQIYLQNPSRPPAEHLHFAKTPPQIRIHIPAFCLHPDVPDDLILLFSGN